MKCLIGLDFLPQRQSTKSFETESIKYNIILLGGVKLTFDLLIRVCVERKWFPPHCNLERVCHKRLFLLNWTCSLDTLEGGTVPYSCS